MSYAGGARPPSSRSAASLTDRTVNNPIHHRLIRPCWTDAGRELLDSLQVVFDLQAIPLALDKPPRDPVLKADLIVLGRFRGQRVREGAVRGGGQGGGGGVRGGGGGGRGGFGAAKPL